MIRVRRRQQNNESARARSVTVAPRGARLEMAAREAARWAWCARAVFARGDGGGALRRRRVVAEADLRRHRVGGVGRASSRVPAVGFGANAFERRDDGPIVRLRVPERGRAVARVDPTHDRDARLRHGRERRAAFGDGRREGRSIVIRETCCETSKRRLDRLARRTHRRAVETARRLRSKKRQSLTGIREWIATNPDRLDRFTAHLACRLLAQHAARAARRGQRRTRRGFLARRGEVAREGPASSEPSNEEEFRILLLA